MLQIMGNSNARFYFEHKAEFEAAEPQVYSQF
jgi:hypothetical protein